MAVPSLQLHGREVGEMSRGAGCTVRARGPGKTNKDHRCDQTRRLSQEDQKKTSTASWWYQYLYLSNLNLGRRGLGTDWSAAAGEQCTHGQTRTRLPYCCSFSDQQVL
jgi:hypothetical protein